MRRAKEAKPTDSVFQHYEFDNTLIGQGTLCDGVVKCKNKLTGITYCCKILD
jgi:hypothetical protein